MMKAIEITCNSIMKSINQRTLTLESGEISDEQLKRIGWLDEKTRDQIHDVVIMLSKIEPSSLGPQRMGIGAKN